MTLPTRLRRIVVAAAAGLWLTLTLGLAACADNGTDQQPGLAGVPAQGAIPPQLVGRWSGGETELFGSTYLHLWPDGRFVWDFEKVPDIAGNVYPTGGQLVMYVNGSPTGSTIAFGGGLLYVDGKSYVYAGPP
jgi:hypothetical protein